MRTRTCPSCNFSFKRCKVIGKERTCPECSEEIFYDGERTILLAIRRAEVESSSMIVKILEDHISKRDGINFVFEGACRAKELKLAYSIIERAEAYLYRQVSIGISAVEFCMEIMEEVLNDKFWGTIIRSIAMFMKHVSTFANTVFLRHKETIDLRVVEDDLTSFADFMSYSEGEGLALNP